MIPTGGRPRDASDMLSKSKDQTLNHSRLPMKALAVARSVKHRGWAASRAVRGSSYRALAGVRDPLFELRYKGSTFHYRPGLFRRSFANWDAPEVQAASGLIPRVVYSFWTGDNELTEARRRNLEVMQEVIGVDVTLVTPHNLDRYEVEGHPLHRAYAGLSYVHRSDYLRAYFMHHHGGGYADIKNPSGSWVPIFDRMDVEPDVWITGYPEHSSLWVAQYRGRLGRELRRRHDSIPGGGSFIVRPRTQLTTEWLAEVHRRLDYFTDLVEAIPGGPRGEDPSYPISWNRLLAQVLHPLALKFHPHVRVDPVLKPQLTNYR